MIEYYRDAALIDEIAVAYKDIDAVLDSEWDLVDVAHRLKQVVCVKGSGSCRCLEACAIKDN